MKSYSKIIAVAAIAAIASSYVQAQGLLSSLSSALSSGTTAAATTGSTAATTGSSALSTAASALSSLAGSGTAAQSTASSIASAVAAAIPAAPTTSSSTANNYMSQLSSLATQALTAYQAKDYIKAASLYPQVQQLYGQSKTALSGLTGAESTQATNWTSSVMGALAPIASSLIK